MPAPIPPPRIRPPEPRTPLPQGRGDFPSLLELMRKALSKYGKEIDDIQKAVADIEVGEFKPFDGEVYPNESAEDTARLVQLIVEKLGGRVGAGGTIIPDVYGKLGALAKLDKVSESDLDAALSELLEELRQQQGRTGQTGQTGPAGQTGLRGLTGYGVPGATGRAGQTGQRGMTGEDGVSPAVTATLTDAGYDITITDRTHPAANPLLISLYHGVDGATGIGLTGSDGQTGATGLTGQTGQTGDRGRTGERGRTGQVGRTGDAGKTGLTGQTGQTGKTGTDGQPGLSIRIVRLSETTASGGTSEIEFSDGTILHVKNGTDDVDFQSRLLALLAMIQEGTSAQNPLVNAGAVALTPVYSQTPTFSEWVIDATGTEYAGTDLRVAWDGTYWTLYSDDSPIDPPDTSADENATSLHFTPQGVTATRTRTDIVGYTLGDQTEKPLQPQGEYAPAANIAKTALASDVQTSLGKADTALQAADVLDGGKIKSAMLPSYVDDVLEFASLADFPADGETGKIYVARDENKTYRWSGTQYVQVGGASDDALVPTLLARYYPDGNVTSASEMTSGVKYTFNESARTATVKPFCYTEDPNANNSNLSGRVVIPPFVDAQGRPYLVDDGTKYKVVAVGGGVPYGPSNELTAIVAPGTVTTVGEYAFASCEALDSVSLPAAIAVGNAAFASCYMLASVSLPDAESIGDSAFYNCNSLASVSLPAATTIYDGAFAICTSLASVSLPAAENIGLNVFGGCGYLASVDFGATPRATVPTLGRTAFSDVPTSCKMIVPDAQYAAWTAASGWSDLVQAGYKFYRHSELEYARRYELPAPADAAPLMDGTASAGSSAAFARGDHVHPKDTSKQDAIADLAAIRSGAAAGATALQSHQQLTSVYEGDKFSTWTVLRDGVDVTSQVDQPVWDPTISGWNVLASVISGEMVSGSISGSVDSMSLTWSSDSSETLDHVATYTATRTENPIIGYTLGDQATKPLQPQTDIPAALAEAVRYDLGAATASATPALPASAFPIIYSDGLGDITLYASDVRIEEGTDVFTLFDTAYSLGLAVFDKTTGALDHELESCTYGELTSAPSLVFPVQLADRKVNQVTVSSDTVLAFPAAVPGKVRDFYAAVTCGATPPTISVLGATLKDAAGAAADLTLSANATTVFRFTETKAATASPAADPVFLVSGGKNGGGSIDPSVLSSKLDSSSAAPAFSESSTYDVGAYVTYNGGLYSCSTAVTTAGAWTGSTNWTAKDMTTPDATLDILADGTLRVASPSGTLWRQGYDLASESAVTLLGNHVNYYAFAATTAAAFSDETAYAVDDRVAYDGKVYKFTAAHSAGAWDSSVVEEDPDTQAMALPTAAAGKVGDFGLDVDNSANTVETEIELTGLDNTFSVVVPEGESIFDMLKFAGGEMAVLYFTLTSFRVNNLPTWQVLKQVVENGGAQS